MLEIRLYFVKEIEHVNFNACCNIGMDDEENDTAPLHEMLNDQMRINFYKGYLAAVAQAIK